MTKTLINYNVDVTTKLIKTLPFFSLVAVHTLSQQSVFIYHAVVAGT